MGQIYRWKENGEEMTLDSSRMEAYKVYHVGEEWKVRLGHGIDTFKTKQLAEIVSGKYFEIDRKAGTIIE